MTVSEAQAGRARYIRTLLAWHDLTQADLAKVLGISQPAANRKLKGKRRFEDDELLAIAEAFDLDPANMLRPPQLAHVMGAARTTAPDLLTWPKYQLPLFSGHIGAAAAGGGTRTSLNVSPRAA